ncbi:MAG: DNA-directed RNA polymerase [Candidatus Micrarchaeota archaeon]|nr:DNA-directed RNA polymerase [Candidatus Micrarchaeota archaeon]
MAQVGEKMGFRNEGPSCGAECEVPFKPTEGRPVYCRDCWQKHKTY